MRWFRDKLGSVKAWHDDDLPGWLANPESAETEYREHEELTSYIASAGGGGAATVIPVADSTGATVDTTSYDNGVTGTGKLTTLVFPQDTGVIAIAIEGDDFPRYVITSDAKDGIYLGDGTVDPYGANGCAINYGPENGGQLELQVQSGVNQMVISDTGARIGTLPTSDPHVAGWLYTVAGVVHVSSG